MGRILRPSWRNGFARYAGECRSEHRNLWRGKVGHWVPSLGCTGINTLFDVSGYGNHGTMNGSMTLDSWVVSAGSFRPFGYALDYNSLNQYIDLNAHIVNTSQPFTYSTWIKRAVTGTAHVIMATTIEVSWLQVISTNFLRYRTNTDGTTGTVTIGTDWTHVAVIYDGTAVSLYVNGVFDTSETKTATNDAANHTLSSTTNDFNGLIDDSRIYNRALSPNEIWQLYTNPLADLRLRRRVMVNVPGGIIINIKDSIFEHEQLTSEISTPIFDKLFGKEIASMTADMPLADASKVKDSISLAAGINILDIIKTKETTTISANISLVELLKAAEQLEINTNIPLSDILKGRDEASSSMNVGIADSGREAEAIDIGSSLSLLDVAKALDSMSINVDIQATERILGSEEVLSSVPIDILEAVKGRDALSITAIIPIAELSEAIDKIQTEASISVIDETLSKENIQANYPLGMTDSVSGIETANIDVNVSIREDSAGEEIIIINKIIYTTDLLSVKELITAGLAALEAIHNLFTSRAKTRFYESPKRS